MSSRTLLKVIGGVAATIVLGAIGSGLWERLLAPSLDWVYRASIDVVSGISLGYKDSIYKSAAKGFHETYSHRAFTIISLLWSLIVLLFAYSNLVAQPKHGCINLITPLFIDLRKEWVRWLVFVASLALSLVIFYSVSKHDAINRTITYSIRSLDILRPHIGEQKYVTMLSDFYQITTAAQFYSFNQALISQAQSSGVTLPELKPL